MNFILICSTTLLYFFSIILLTLFDLQKHECDHLEQAVGGPEELSKISGSRAYCRFSGNQIAKVFRLKPEIYHATARISLVSSFLSSILIGKWSLIDTSDGSGMNLMDIWAKEWSEKLMVATAPNLGEKLGDHAVNPWEPAGTLSPFFQKFGFASGVTVISCSGDNPNSICGMGLQSTEGEEADLVVSLGTSDTLMGLTRHPRPALQGHVLASPSTPDEYFVMLCFKNGAVAREHVRDLYCSRSWKTFSEALASSKPGNHGKLGLYLLMEEITPQMNHTGTFHLKADGTPAESFSAQEEVRAAVEGRFLSMRVHAQALGISRPRRILATGGGALNKEMMQVGHSI